MIEVDEKTAIEVALIQKALLAPFDLGMVKFKPQSVKGNRALALCYIDARLVMDRLDEVVHIDGWKDEYTVYPSGAVECRLSVKLGGEWVTKADVGGQSEQPDEDDRMKAAYSDALKRAAVKFGIGRFLYRATNAWHDYDPVKKQFAYPLMLMADGKIVARPRDPNEKAEPEKKPEPKKEPELTLRDRAIKALRECKNRPAYLEVCSQLHKDREAGRFSPEDRNVIADVSKQINAKFPAPKQTA